MLGALSKRETDLLNEDLQQVFNHNVELRVCLIQKKLVRAIDEHDESNSEDREPEWDPELDLDKERGLALKVLGQIVPQAEIFLKSSGNDRN